MMVEKAVMELNLLISMRMMGPKNNRDQVAALKC